MIPRKLTDWNLDVIRKLLSQGYHESESFDFKEKLPDSRDNENNERLHKTCCAFANSLGGFLVFGIKDDKSLSLENRLIGVDSKDFPEHFGKYPAQCNPGIYWDFLNPPIELPNGKLIHVIEIPKSWKAPHSVKHKNESWFFMKRTNKGNEHMTQEEIKLTYLGYYEKRLKLQLLNTELKNIVYEANEMLGWANSNDMSLFPVSNFNLDIIETVLVDVYTILVDESKVLELLNQIRGDCRAANKRIQIFHDKITHLLNEIDRMSVILSHKSYLQINCPRIKNNSEQALLYLEGFLKK